jgi:hypothetical protein
VDTPLKLRNPRIYWAASPHHHPRFSDLLLIVTGIAKGVYQKHGYMNPTLTPKISLANKANLINQVAAPTKAVNQKTKY